MKSKRITVKGKEITIITVDGKESISITDMDKAKDGFFYFRLVT